MYKKTVLAALTLLAMAWWAGTTPAETAAPFSEATQACLDCHVQATPGIVADWKKSAHAKTTLEAALGKEPLARRVSAKAAPPGTAKTAVGCAECHLSRGVQRPDSFQHDAFTVHTVVSPPDCARCHPVEEEQYRGNLMSHAWGNLVHNPLYMDLAKHVNGVQKLAAGGLQTADPDAATQAESCLYCHGTEIKVDGAVQRQTDFGEFSIPRLTGWPNHGVGRKNPDGSLGSCGACHSRHQFSIAMARSPYTCSECHKGPDVPAYKVYQVSKHGNIYYAMNKEWNLTAVPWTAGRDFTAPTCAACHVSLLVDGQGNTVAQRSHAMSDRIWWRLVGLIFSAPHPRSPDTSIIRNADGQPLPTTLDGKPAAGFLIDAAEQDRRKTRMTGVCRACHSTQWVDGQMARLENTIGASDAMVLAATELMQEAWRRGLATGPPGASPFDEYVERLWVEQWLFFANSTRFASAMVGADLGVFEQGRWDLAKRVRQLQDWMDLRRDAPPKAKPGP